MGIGVVDILQRVGAVAVVALQLNIIGAGSDIGHGVDDGGVLPLGIHVLVVAVVDGVAVSIERVHTEPREAERRLRACREGDAALLRHHDLVPVDGIGVAVEGVAQLSSHGGSALQRHGLLPRVVRLGVGLVGMTGEVGVERVATIAVVAAQAHIVGADGYVGHLVDDGGVPPLCIHILVVAVVDGCTVGIERVHTEPRQAQRRLSLGGEGDLPLFGYDNLHPVFGVGVAVEVVAETSVGRRV